jgi:hypothetical protein
MQKGQVVSIKREAFERLRTVAMDAAGDVGYDGDGMNGVRGWLKKRALASPAARARSRISNRKVILPELNDGRSAPARRYRDLVNAYIADMGVRRTYPPIKI